MSLTFWDDYRDEIADAREAANLDRRQERHGEGVPSELEIAEEDAKQGRLW